MSSRRTVLVTPVDFCYRERLLMAGNGSAITIDELGNGQGADRATTVHEPGRTSRRADSRMIVSTPCSKHGVADRCIWLNRRTSSMPKT